MSKLTLEIWKARDILKGVEINNPSRNATVKGGVRDPRLGTTDQTPCATCGKDRFRCPGHWGYIRLAVPIFHPIWVRSVLQALKLTCGQDQGGETLAERARRAKKGAKCYRWDKTKQVVTCDGQPLKNMQVLQRLGKYQHLMLTCLPVPPNNIRPPLMSGTKVRGENSITYRLIQIVRANNKLLKFINERRPAIVVEHAVQYLQTQVSDLMDHEKGKRTVNARAYDSYSSRLKGKDGTIRGKGMGKRVNFCARGVICCDDSLRLGEVGVPRSVAATLTKPVRVTDYNIRALEDEKIRYVVKRGKKIDMTVAQVALDVGDVCEVQLKDGDTVLFNRQPSLHAQSIMAHTVRIRDQNVFSLNSAVLAPYGADCDGDEMSLYAPQSEEALAEAQEIMAVHRNIINSQSNKPIIFPIQDTILATYRISKETFTRDEWARLGFVGEGPGTDILARIIPLEHWGGRLRGNKLTGVVKKAHLNSHGGILQAIHNDVSPQACADFIHRLQELAHRYFDLRGFSIGVEDVLEDTAALCEEEIARAFRDVRGKPEEEVNRRLNQCRDTLGRACLQNVDNSFRECVVSGSKGNESNLVWILGAIGQQNVAGKRAAQHWTGRTLPHVKDETPLDRGFIKSNYTRGLSPRELWFGAASAREGLVDTSIKTSETGYTERKLLKALENVRARYGMAWDLDRVVEFQYGDDGTDPARDEKVQYVEPEPEPWLQPFLTLARGTKTCPIPVTRWHYPGDGSLRYGEEHRNAILALTEPFPPRMRAFVVAETAPSILRAYDYGERQWEELLRKIERAWHLSRVPDGDGVGAKAGCSIAERTTQLTLRTFHYAGTSQVTLGIPRIREILDVSKSIATPMRYMEVPDPEAFVRERRRVTLRDVLVSRGEPRPGEMDAYWQFPDPGGRREDPHVRLELYPWVDYRALKKHFKYVAYTQGPRMVVHAYGPFDEDMVLKGDVPCATCGDKVETTMPLSKCLGMNLKSTSNDIYEVYNTLGVEAARKTIVNEFQKILNHYGVYINTRHLLLLASWMCQDGQPTPLTRHGLAKNPSFVFQATFERVVQTLHDAAVEGKTDPLAGVSECVLAGKVPRFCPADVLKDHVLETKFQVPRPDNDPYSIIEEWIPTIS